MSTVWTNLSGLEFSQRYVNAEGIRTRVIEAGNGEGDPLIFYMAPEVTPKLTVEILKNMRNILKFMSLTLLDMGIQINRMCLIPFRYMRIMY